MREVYKDKWVDEFLKLQAKGFRGEGVVNLSLSENTSPPAPDPEELERLGYVRVRNYEYLIGLFIEEWVRPSGTTITVTRSAPKEQPTPVPQEIKEENAPPEPTEDEDKIEAMGDISRRDLEEMVGFKIPGFLRADIVDEDDEGNRTIKVDYFVVDEEGWEETKHATIPCFEDDTCDATPQMFE